MVGIFEKTPIWVWMLLGFLVVLGYLQTKERTLPLARALIIPLIMFFFSLQGVVSIVSPLLLNVPWFFLGASFCLGALGGIFVARVFVMYCLWR